MDEKLNCYLKCGHNPCKNCMKKELQQKLDLDELGENDLVCIQCKTPLTYQELTNIDANLSRQIKIKRAKLNKQKVNLMSSQLLCYNCNSLNIRAPQQNNLIFCQKCYSTQCQQCGKMKDHQKCNDNEVKKAKLSYYQPNKQ